MKYIKLICAMVVVWAPAFVSLAVAPDAGTRSVAIGTVGPIDQAVVERAVSFAKENTAMESISLRVLDCEKETLEEVGRCAAATLGENELCMIVLAWMDELPEIHGLHLPEEKIFVVNVYTLKTDGVSEEIFGRRVERQVMQNIGLLLGMDTCPNPQCVLWPYSSLQELDAKGRNYCPPCLDRLQRKALDAGCSLSQESPFNMQ